jgi:hypothetical protein
MANATVTLDKSQLSALIAEAVALALGNAKAAKQVTGPNGLNAKSERSLKNEIAVVRAFKKEGFGNVTPHVDVMTFNRWVANGMRPIEGSKSLKVKNLRLFHKTQCRNITPEEKAALKEQNDAAIARHDANQPKADATITQ